MSDVLSRIANTIPIRWGYFMKNGKRQKTMFIGHEKAIYGADGVQLDSKLLNIKDSISDAFSEEKDYAVGDYCIYLNSLYKFTAAKAAGAWDGSKVIPVSVSQELAALNSKHSVIGEQVGNFHYYNFEPPESNKSVMEDFQSELYKFPVGCTLIGDYARSGQFIFIGMVYSNRSYAFFLVLGVTGGLRIVKNWDGSWTETGIN